jgi:hypothetical protein
VCYTHTICLGFFVVRNPPYSRFTITDLAVVSYTLYLLYYDGTFIAYELRRDLSQISPIDFTQCML